MSIATRLIPVIVLACAGSSLAQSGFTYLVDGRRCTAFFSGDGSGSAWENPPNPFGLYQGGASIEAENGVETWSASCTHLSSLNPDSMSMTSTATAFVTGSTPNTLNAQSTSLFDVRFVCAVDTPYRLAGIISESGHPNSFGDIRLTTLLGVEIHAAISAAQTATPFSFEGTLAPGTYVLVARAQSRAIAPGGQSATGDAACSFTLSVASSQGCAVDWNGDSVINSVDFMLFLTEFLTGDADYNDDGVTNSDDFFSFVDNFLNGC